MNVSRHFVRAAAAACALLLASATVAVAADNDVTAGKIVAPRAFRSSTLVGMEVKNPSGESVGKIDELVIDIEKGNVEYAALSVGGFLGIGDKLFAVPWRLFSVKFDEKTSYMVLDVTKEELEKAPGFDKNHWPNVAQSDWKEQIDRYYAGETHDGVFVSADAKTLVMRAEGQEKTHSHVIDGNLRVMSGGQAATLQSLREGDKIRVTARTRNGHSYVTMIEVLKR